MITTEMVNLLLHSASKKQFDVCLYALLRTDWDGYVRATAKEIATSVKTKAKYVREIFKKFTTNQLGRRVLVLEKTEDGNLYRLNIAKPRYLPFNANTDLYCKKYTFFYEEEFLNLPIDAKRLLLKAAYYMSIYKKEDVRIRMDELVPNTHNNVRIPFTKKRVREAIKCIQESSLKDIVQIEVDYHELSDEEILLFTFKKGTLNDYKENRTERDLLRLYLFESGCQYDLTDEQCKQIERVGKYIYNSLRKNAKKIAQNKGLISDAKNDIHLYARAIYKRALKKFAHAFNIRHEEFEDASQASAYLSKIVYDIMTEETKEFRHKAFNLDSLWEKANIQTFERKKKEAEERGVVLPPDETNEELLPLQKQQRDAEFMADITEYWCEDWVLARIKANKGDKEEDKQEYIESLKASTMRTIHSAIDDYEKRKTITYTWNRTWNYLNMVKNRLTSYFSVLLDDDRKDSDKFNIEEVDTEEIDLPF